MKHLTIVAGLMTGFAVLFWLTASGLTRAMTGQGPTGFLSALYVAAGLLLAASWAADVAAPAGVRR